MNHRLIVLLGSICLLPDAAPLRADVTPNFLFSDNAVLQRDKKIPVWGTAADGEKVTVEFAGQKAETTAKDGRWKVELQPVKATAEGQTMTFTGNNVVKASNVVVGEVWLCSGQSNMELLLKLSERGREVASSANDAMLRMVCIPRREMDEPQSNAVATWRMGNPNSSAEFSAVAFYFGRELRKVLDVPIGLIGSYYGNTPAQAWMDRETLAGDADFKKMLDEQAKAESEFDPVKFEAQVRSIQEKFDIAAAQALAEGKPKPRGPVLPVPPNKLKQRPACLYNGMIAPLQPYAIRGVIWYQGESNNADPILYRKLFPALIHSWREQWGQGDFPFLFVQIAPFKDLTPGLREAQLLALESTKNTAMAVTTDVGNPVDIHPTNKEPVGHRLSLAARALAYGEKIEFSGPLYSSMRVEGNKAIVSFSHTGGGLIAKDGDLRGFMVAGSDGRFFAAQAEIKGESVEVSSPGVQVPTVVRYGWANAPDVNLFNKEGLPASPFRTDISNSFNMVRGDLPPAGADLLESTAMTNGLVRIAKEASSVNGGVEVGTSEEILKPCEYLWTDGLPLQSGHRYRISYDYTVRGANPGSFYSLFTGGSADGKADRFYEVWNGNPGDAGHRDFTVTVVAPATRLMMGIKKGGIRLDSLRIEELPTTNAPGAK
ncbi:MAG: sialate O-acetylesterase [bacterium]